MSTITLDQSQMINVNYTTIREWLQDTVQTVYDLVLPKNDYTGCREFRLIPTCAEQITGYLTYPLALRATGGVIRTDNLRYGHYARMVHEISQEIAAKSPRKLDFECEVVNSKTENAWCLPGGKIAITLGLIRKMEKDHTDYKLGYTPTTYEKIAAVLCHEAAHAGARHHARSLELYGLILAILTPLETTLASILFALEATDWLVTGSMLFKSRSHELEADRYGMVLLEKLSREGNNNLNRTSPKAALWVQQYFVANHDHTTGYLLVDLADHVMSTHPSPQERLEANTKTWEQIQQKTITLY